LRTARAAWAAIEPGATHHLVLQDDVTPADDLLHKIRRSVEARPQHALAFFAEWGCRTSNLVRVAALCGHRWVEIVDFYVPTQALVMPAPVAEALAEHFSSLPEDTPDDHAIHGYLRKLGVPAWVSVPNLVEHDDSPSLIGNGPYGLRRSTCLVDDSAMSWEGDSLLTGLTLFPNFSWWDLAAECWAREGSQASDWWRMPADELVNSVHVPQKNMQEMMQEDGLDARAIEIPKEVLRDLWVCAFSLGVLAAGCQASSGMGKMRDIGDSIPHAALASLAPGALRRLIDPRENPSVYASLGEITESAVLKGIGWANQSVHSFPIYRS
jgi:hypothetical protein